jgi:hypothetical protein
MEGAIQAFRELPESTRGLAKLFVLFFEAANGLHAHFKRITLVGVAHGPPFTAVGARAKKGPTYG